MIPIRDTIQSKSYPVVNTALIALNGVVFLVELIQGPRLNEFIFVYGLVPARYSVPEIGSYFSFGQQVFSLLSFMFIHGGFWHLLGNMWSLHIFGDNVEDQLGPVRYLFFYLLCGWFSGLSHLLINWHSHVPTIGASGAIAGVMGAYLVLYPSSKILTLIPIFFLPYFVEVPAFFFLGIWFVIQFLSAAGTSGQSGGIAWWAHVGGFVFGIIFLKLFSKIPELGLSSKLRLLTSKSKTHRLHVVRSVGKANDPHLYGNLWITPLEAKFGTRKLVNVPWGFQKRLIRVTVPPGVNHGTILRLSGMGKQLGTEGRGDLYLTVLIHPQ